MRLIQRFILVAAIALAFGAMAFGQEIVINGDTGTVEVERQVVVKEKLQLIKSLPFALNTAAGGFAYSWDVPATWKTAVKEHVLEVTAAPKGIVTVSVKW